MLTDEEKRSMASIINHAWSEKKISIDLIRTVLSKEIIEQIKAGFVKELTDELNQKTCEIIAFEPYRVRSQEKAKRIKKNNSRARIYLILIKYSDQLSILLSLLSSIINEVINSDSGILNIISPHVLRQMLNSVLDNQTTVDWLLLRIKNERRKS